MIQVEGLTKDYGARLAVDNLTFHANKGEIVGFLGPNGAGKTTTMRILSGYMPPTAGRALIAGYDVVEQSLEVRKRVGYLPETVPLYQDMTVFDYLKFMAELRRVSEVESRVEDVLEMVHLEERIDSYIASLSKGMRQRVGLAQALLHEPDVLILDEPTIGLDPVQIIEVRNLIQELGKEHTVLLSTHILSEAQQICNRVLIINKGKIVAEDTPQRLQEHLIGVQRYALQVAGDGDGLADLLANVSGVKQVYAPAAYLIAFFLLLIMGLIFYANLASGVLQQFAPDMRDVFGVLIFLLVITTPAITMNLLAEEQRMGTIELLLTAPVRDWELVTGKWLGGFLFLMTLLVVTLVYPVILNFIVTPGIDMPLLLSGYLGLILFCSALVAVGVTISSFFSNQVATFFLTLAIFLFLWIIGFLGQVSPAGSEVLTYLDLRAHYTETFLAGIVDMRDIVYYLSLTVLSLFLGSIFTEARRWR